MERRLDVSGATQVTASTAVSAVVLSVLCALLRAGIAVQELVAVHAAVLAVAADENAAVHVRGTGWSLDGHGAALHVDLARNINDTHGAECEFSPRVGDLSIDHLGVGVDS